MPDEPPVMTAERPCQAAAGAQLNSPFARPPSISSVMPDDVGRTRRAEERDRVGDLARLAEAARRDQALVGRARAGRIVAARVDVLHAVGVDVAGRDRVHGDAVRALVLRQRLGPADHAGAVDVREQQAVVRLLHGGRRDVDDPPAAALAQLGQRHPRQAQRRHQRQLPGVAPGVLVEVLEATGRRAAGVVDEDVEAAEAARASGRAAPGGRTARASRPRRRAPRAPVPSAPIAATVSSSFSLRRAKSVTLHPSAASDMAVACPMPDDDPVTIATHPCRPSSIQNLISQTADTN